MTKKKPSFTVHNAHTARDDDTDNAPWESWVTSVAAVRNTDLVASGKLYIHYVEIYFTKKNTTARCDQL